ncbi:uncharacterized protein PHACADRAFT_251391, partial [Phanerochaete carnosa HHB-10118-sp]
MSNSVPSPEIIPLAVLCGGLVIGGFAAVLITRKIARQRLLLELRSAAEARIVEDRLGEKPVLVDIYVGPSPDESSGDLHWTIVQPISTTFNAQVSSPHPHHTIEKRPGYLRTPLVDGNVLQVSMGISMPTPPFPNGTEAFLESCEYCIGTSDVVLCTLLGARQRLVGI